MESCARSVPPGRLEAWEAVPESGVDNAAYYYSTNNARTARWQAPTLAVMVLCCCSHLIGQGNDIRI